MIKKLNRRQVRQAEILIKYDFKIKHIKGTDNIRADILNRKAELQRGKKPLNTILKLNKDGKIKYDHLQLVGTHKTLRSL